MARRFAIPWVVVACGGATPSPVALERAEEGWSLTREGDSCWAEESEGNPPPVTKVQCVYGDAEYVKKVEGDCWVTYPEPVRQVPCPDDVEIEEPAEAPSQDVPDWMYDGPI